MRHRVAGKKLNRTSSHRKALAMNLMRAFLIEWQGKGHIVTTRSKAKFIQPKIEKLISLSRNKTVHNVRRAMALIGDKDVVQVLFDEIGPYYSERPGGYTRVLRLVKPRLGDASVRAYLGYVREDDEYPEGDCAVEAVVSEEAASEEADGAGSDEIASDDGEVQGAAAADSTAADESDSAEVEAAAGEQSGAQEAVSEAQEDSESAEETTEETTEESAEETTEETTEESAEESDEASKQAEAEVEDSSISEQEEETPPEKDQ